MTLQQLIEKLKLDGKGYVGQFEYYVTCLKSGTIIEGHIRTFCDRRLQGILEGLYLVEYITYPEYSCLSEEVNELYVNV